MVDVKSQLTDPITNIMVYTIVYNTNAWESSVCVDIDREYSIPSLTIDKSHILDNT